MDKKSPLCRFCNDDRPAEHLAKKVMEKKSARMNSVFFLQLIPPLFFLFVLFFLIQFLREIIDLLELDSRLVLRNRINNKFLCFFVLDTHP